MKSVDLVINCVVKFNLHTVLSRLAKDHNLDAQKSLPVRLVLVLIELNSILQVDLT